MKSFYLSDIQIRSPCNVLVSGPSGSGKTQFLIKLIKNASTMIYPPPAEILYAYCQYNDNIPELESIGVKTFSGIPTENDLSAYQKPLLFILEDALDTISEQTLEAFMIRQSHHLNLIFVFVTQHLFSKKLRGAKKSVHYYVLLRAPSDLHSIKSLGIQLAPNQNKFFYDSYKKATSKPYSYLLCDVHPSSPPELKLRSNIFPGETVTVYQPS